MCGLIRYNCSNKIKKLAAAAAAVVVVEAAVA